MGQESIEDDERPGRPVDVILEVKVALVEKLVLSNRRLKVIEIAEMPKLSDTTVRRILHDYECARFFLELCGADPNPVWGPFLVFVGFRKKQKLQIAHAFSGLPKIIFSENNGRFLNVQIEPSVIFQLRASIR
nr:unnamed protein product [Callosobruchus analis]